MRSSLKTILITALLILLPAVAAAQSTIGFRGGLSLASLGGDDAENFDSKTGLSFGGFFNVPVSDMLGVQVGAGFVKKGANQTESGIDIGFELGYVEIPLLLTYSPPTSGNVGFTFSVGPAVGFKTGCNFSATSAGSTVELDCDDPTLDVGVKSFEVGAMVGAGLNFALTESVSLHLDAFYNYGITKIDDSGADDDVKNRAFSILAGLSFPLRLGSGVGGVPIG